jgi:hypothetical protein
VRAQHARAHLPETQHVHMPHLRSDAGEHSDWAGSYRRFNRDLAPGMCLVSGTNQGMYARVRPHPHKLIVSSVDHAGNKYGPVELLMDPEVLLKAAASGDSYFSYIYGVAYQIAVRYNCRGLVIENYKTDLPQAKGLSSVPHSQPRMFAPHHCCCCSHLLPIHACLRTVSRLRPPFSLRVPSTGCTTSSCLCEAPRRCCHTHRICCHTPRVCCHTSRVCCHKPRACCRSRLR